MKAIVITRPGPPEVLQARDRPAPAPGPDEVRVAVRAAGVNRADLLQRRGLYPAPPGSIAEDVPGLEFAGEVELVGARVRGLAPGDRVMGIVAGGAYAERLCVHRGLCVAVPTNMGWEQAAATPEAFITAWDALRRAELAAGDTLLLAAAGSGVGTAALQLACVSGARVVALSRTPDKRTRLEQLGAHAVLDPGHPELLDAIRGAADGGVDVVFDMVGASAWPLYLDALRPCGRVVVVGLLGGSRANVDLAKVLSKRLRLIGTVLRSRSVEEKVVLLHEWARHVLPLLSAGRLRPVVDEVFSLDEAARAHDRLERNASFGKLVLRVASD